MRFAAIETATAVTAVAVGEDDDVVEVLADDRRRHTEALAPCLAALLEDRGWSLGDLDVVVVDVGPGLFTGLRVGVATAKGIGVATGVGLLGVSSTEVLAQGAFDAGIRGDVAAVVDVRRGEVVAARYRCDAGGTTELEGPALFSPSALAARLGGRGGHVVAVGDGAARHRDDLVRVDAEVRDDLVVPSPRSAIRLARRRLAAGGTTLGHEAVHPWYARDADAVANFPVRGTVT